MPTPERIWADAHPGGQVRSKAGPVFSFWNFEMNRSEPRIEHLAFLRGHEFTLFLTRNLNRGREILFTGCSSVSSGQSRINRNLAFQRAANMIRETYLYLQILRQRGDIDRSVSNAALGQLIKYGTKPATADSFFFHPGDPLRIPVDNEGLNMAYNRTVIVEASPVNRLSRERIEFIGRRYLRQRLPTLPDYFPFWEMWIPDYQSYQELIPATFDRMLPGSSVGRNIPQRANWFSYRPGYEALRVLGVGYITVSGVLSGHYYNAADVQEILNRFLNQGSHTRRQIEAEEAHVLRAFEAQTGFGSFPTMDEVGRYKSFRNEIVLNRTDSILKFNGYNPRI